VTSGPVPDPLFRSWQGEDGSRGGLVSYRPDDQAAAEAMRQHMRETLGPEGFARWERSMEADQDPRPLTNAEREVLRRATAPLLADLSASGLPVPDIREEAHEEREEAVCGWLQGPDGLGQGIWVLLGASPAEQVAWLAEQFQDWAADWPHDAGRPLHWPACPRHPDPPHRLAPQVRDDRAVWTCAENGQVIWPVGELVTPGGTHWRASGPERSRPSRH
jgi:hypothetical protein